MAHFEAKYYTLTLERMNPRFKTSKTLNKNAKVTDYIYIFPILGTGPGTKPLVGPSLFWFWLGPLKDPTKVL